MLKNIGIAALLISGLYTDVQLWACKQAVAQKSDQVLPDGSIIHRRMLTFPQCLGPDKADPDWVHDGPCETTDIGFIDKQRHVHFTHQSAIKTTFLLYVTISGAIARE